MSSVTVSAPEEMMLAAEMILQNSGDIKVIALHGEMGAGKTTMVKAFCRLLEVTDSVSSPTFSILNEYRTKNGLPVYHFDFYRIKTVIEAFDLGFESYFFSGNYCLIEWPEKIKELLDFPCLNVYISVSGEKRIVTLHA
jgi:tRNA threonylcarbamoyladenosine biosynthesis protein TsaE